MYKRSSSPEPRATRIGQDGRTKDADFRFLKIHGTWTMDKRGMNRVENNGESNK
jgi:hypothetical protein